MLAAATTASQAAPTAASGGAATATRPAAPAASPAVSITSVPQSGKEKTAVIYYNGKPYSNWTGIRFWTNMGVPSRLQWEPLLDIDDDLKPAPGLAEKWELVSSTVSRYYLRSGLKWSDGTPITAKDIVFSLNLTFNKDLGTLMSTEIATIKGGDDVKAGKADTLSGVRALDDQTIEIETAVPEHLGRGGR